MKTLVFDKRCREKLKVVKNVYKPYLTDLIDTIVIILKLLYYINQGQCLGFSENLLSIIAVSNICISEQT